MHVYKLDHEKNGHSEPYKMFHRIEVRGMDRREHFSENRRFVAIYLVECVPEKRDERTNRTNSRLLFIEAVLIHRSESNWGIVGDYFYYVLVQILVSRV